MPALAALPMYDWPETRPALDKFWQLIAHELEARGLSAPSNLIHDQAPMLVWQNPDLIVGQTCGWPFMNRLRDDVVPFARFDHGLADCPPGDYFSVLVAKHENAPLFPEETINISNLETIAINGEDSQSGFHVWAEFADNRADDAIAAHQRVITGSHRASLKAVADGLAQIAAVDAVSFELAKQHDPDIISKLCLVGRTLPKPGLPLVTSKHNAPYILDIRQAVFDAVGKLDAQEKAGLRIFDCMPATAEDYAVYLDEKELQEVT